MQGSYQHTGGNSQRKNRSFSQKWKLRVVLLSENKIREMKRRQAQMKDGHVETDETGIMGDESDSQCRHESGESVDDNDDEDDTDENNDDEEENYMSADSGMDQNKGATIPISTDGTENNDVKVQDKGRGFSVRDDFIGSDSGSDGGIPPVPAIIDIPEGERKDPAIANFERMVVDFFGVSSKNVRLSEKIKAMQKLKDRTFKKDCRVWWHKSTARDKHGEEGEEEKARNIIKTGQMYNTGMSKLPDNNSIGIANRNINTNKFVPRNNFITERSMYKFPYKKDPRKWLHKSSKNIKKVTKAKKYLENVNFRNIVFNRNVRNNLRKDELKDSQNKTDTTKLEKSCRPVGDMKHVPIVFDSEDSSSTEESQCITSAQKRVRLDLRSSELGPGHNRNLERNRPPYGQHDVITQERLQALTFNSPSSGRVHFDSKCGLSPLRRSGVQCSHLVAGQRSFREVADEILARQIYNDDLASQIYEVSDVDSGPPLTITEIPEGDYTVIETSKAVPLVQEPGSDSSGGVNIPGSQDRSAGCGHVPEPLIPLSDRRDVPLVGEIDADMSSDDMESLAHRLPSPPSSESDDEVLCPCPRCSLYRHHGLASYRQHAQSTWEAEDLLEPVTSPWQGFRPPASPTSSDDGDRESVS